MKLGVRLILIAANLALCSVLLFLWIHPDGSIRNVRWQQPAPIAANLDGLVPSLAPLSVLDTSRFLSTLDRPLFASSRRPPPPPPPPAAEQPPPPIDHLSTARLLGVLKSAASGYAILEINGKRQRVQLSQGVEGWTLQSIGAREAVFGRGAETRNLTMQRADVSKFKGVAQATIPAASRALSSTASPASDIAAGSDAGVAAGDGRVAPVTPSPPKRPPSPRFGP